MSDMMDDIQPDLREQAYFLLVIFDDRYESTQQESWHHGGHVWRNLPILAVEEAAEVESAVSRVNVLLN